MSDLIDRRAAIDAMANTLWHYPNECYRNLNEYEFAKGLAELGLKSVPSAQPEQHWIPCSERLPAYGEDVILAIGEFCNVGYLVAVNDETDGEWYYSGWYHPMNDVIAWMPLPEPYQAERREK